MLVRTTTMPLIAILLLIGCSGQSVKHSLGARPNATAQSVQARLSVGMSKEDVERVIPEGTTLFSIGDLELTMYLKDADLTVYFDDDGHVKDWKSEAPSD